LPPLPNRPPVRRSGDYRPPDLPSSPSSRPSKAALQPDALAAEVVDQLAARIADLISDRVISAVMDTIGHTPGPSTPRLVDAAAIAQQFGVARRYVYDHQRELGAVRLGHGPRARLRFDPSHVEASLERRTQPAPTARGRRRRDRTDPPAQIDLLPIKTSM
jgi:hypothetical protein